MKPKKEFLIFTLIGTGGAKECFPSLVECCIRTYLLMIGLALNFVIKCLIIDDKKYNNQFLYRN